MLRCDATSVGNRTPIYWNNLLSSFSRVETSMVSIYLVTHRHIQNYGIPRHTAAETSRLAIKSFTPPEPGYRKLV